MKNIYKYAIVSSVLLSPLISFAAPKTLKDIASMVTEYLNIGLALIIGLAVVTFVWNIYKYFFVEKDRKEAGLYVLFSVLGFVVIISFWGLVNLIKNSVPLDNNAPNIVPFGGNNGTINTNYNGGGGKP